MNCEMCKGKGVIFSISWVRFIKYMTSVLDNNDMMRERLEFSSSSKEDEKEIDFWEIQGRNINQWWKDNGYSKPSSQYFPIMELPCPKCNYKNKEDLKIRIMDLNSKELKKYNKLLKEKKEDSIHNLNDRNVEACGRMIKIINNINNMYTRLESLKRARESLRHNQCVFASYAKEVASHLKYLKNEGPCEDLGRELNALVIKHGMENE